MWCGSECGAKKLGGNGHAFVNHFSKEIILLHNNDLIFKLYYQGNVDIAGLVFFTVPLSWTGKVCFFLSI